MVTADEILGEILGESAGEIPRESHPHMGPVRRKEGTCPTAGKRMRCCFLYRHVRVATVLFLSSALCSWFHGASIMGTLRVYTFSIALTRNLMQSQ